MDYALSLSLSLSIFVVPDAGVQREGNSKTSSRNASPLKRSPVIVDAATTASAWAAPVHRNLDKDAAGTKQTASASPDGDDDDVDWVSHIVGDDIEDSPPSCAHSRCSGEKQLSLDARLASAFDAAGYSQPAAPSTALELICNPLDGFAGAHQSQRRVSVASYLSTTCQPPAHPELVRQMSERCLALNSSAFHAPFFSAPMSGVQSELAIGRVSPFFWTPLCNENGVPTGLSSAQLPDVRFQVIQICLLLLFFRAFFGCWATLQTFNDLLSQAAYVLSYRQF